MINKFGKAFLTLFCIGYFKYAPGTAASFITCLTWYMVGDFTDFSLHKNKIYISFFLIIIVFYSIIMIDRIYKKKDSREIVIDEFIGQSIPLVAFLYRPENFIPNCCYKSLIEMPSVLWIVFSFLLFRFFDIIKPYPINLIDRKIKNGLGVMLDDILAGIFTTIVMYIIYSLWF